MDSLIRTGEPAPDFDLPDLDGRRYHLSGQRGHVTVLHFWSAVCPWTERTDRDVLEAVRGQEADLWSIASNADEPADVLRRTAQARGLPLVLKDGDQRVADLYGAAATPHIFVVDQDGLLRYGGAVHDARFRDPEPRHRYLVEALASIERGEDPVPATTHTYGCAIVRSG
jgi:peroxiredoxin